MKRSILLLGFLFLALSINAQTIKPEKGFSNDIGNMISMMDDLKGRITRNVASLSTEQTDYLLDDEANRIGAMIYHLAATEKYYQLYTFENRSFNPEEQKTWGVALGLGDEGREAMKGKPIDYYLDIWSEVRAESKRLLKTKDDKWFSKKVKGSSILKGI